MLESRPPRVDAGEDFAVRAAAYFEDGKEEVAVVEHERRARCHVARERGERHADPLRCPHARLRRDEHVRPGEEADRAAGHLADADARPAQVAEDRHGHAGRLANAADPRDARAQRVVFRVGEIDAHDVEARVDHGAQGLVPVAGRAEGGDDFCPFALREHDDAEFAMSRRDLERGLCDKEPMADASTTICPGCGGRFPALAGPVHRYMESSPGCWAVYGEVLAREYGERAYYEMHKFTVDAYAVQHPGRPSAQSIQSVGVHLVRLCLMLERGFDAERATAAIQLAATNKSVFRWLDPPASRGEVTVADVHRATSSEEHAVQVRAWAGSAWAAWAAHHETVRGWIPKSCRL